MVALVMLPLVMFQEYVEAPAGALAWLPVEFGQRIEGDGGVMVADGVGLTVVKSLAVSLPGVLSMLPETVTVLIRLAGAFVATLTVTVIGG